jgi:hypothetical protein
MMSPKPAQLRPTYLVALRPARARDGVRELKALLKIALRQHGLRCVTLREVHDTNTNLRAPKVPPPARDLQSGNRNEPQIKGATQMATREEAFPSRYWKAADLKQPTRLKIVEVNMETLKARDGTSSRKPVIYFHGKKKALAVNATNFDSIVNITGEFNSDDWVGHEVELFATTTMMGGKETDCIRVRAPSAAARLLPRQS